MVDMVNQRKKHFAEERAKAKRNKLMTQSQLRIYMSNYLKNQGTWKLSQLKKLKFEEIKEEFDKLIQQIDTFVPINLEATKAKLKRCGEELQTKTSKKQKIEDKDVPAIGEKFAEVKEEEQDMFDPPLIGRCYLELPLPTKRWLDRGIDDKLLKYIVYLGGMHYIKLGLESDEVISSSGHVFGNCSCEEKTVYKTKAARSRQKSYADVRRKPLEFVVGDMVMLKVSSWKGVIRFRKHGKLSPRYIGPFKIVARVGPMAYKLELPEELRGIHDMFHFLNLKKCLADENFVIPLGKIKVDDKLHFIEEPVEIVDREVKQLKQSRILIVKVCWDSRRGPEFIWECEDQFKNKYPHHFVKNDRADVGIQIITSLHNFEQENKIG
ncbi:hypothetical protein Tco_1263668 [Tanacetum coccineum]